MKVKFLLACLWLSYNVVMAADFNYKFNSESLSEALTQIAEEHPKLNLNFIYNELDHYKTTARISTDDPADALMQIIGLNPVTIIRKGNRFYIEALQHGRYSYAGRAVDNSNEPVVAATVMLLAPKDSTVITYGITDDAGYFSIPCDKEKVVAKLTCLGYKPEYKRCDSFAVGTITMDELPIRLQVVSIAAAQSQTSTDRTIYRPTNRQKNASQTAVDLLRNLAIPQITVNLVDESVTTLAGAPVVIYVNGLPASDEELRGIRTADVRTVEYLEFPVDPRFGGNEHVLNFIMQKYEYGGYTKLSASENFMVGLSSRVSLYSKFTYKSMVYDLYAGTSNHNLHHAGASRIGRYTLLDHDGADQTITRCESFDYSHFRYNQYPLTFRAVYDNDKTQIANTVGLNFDQSPVAQTRGRLSYSPGGGVDYVYNTNQPYTTGHFVWSGACYFILPDGSQLSLNPGATYGHTDYSYSFTASLPGQEVISNTSIEHYYNLHGGASLYKGLSEKHSIMMNLYGGTNHNEVSYGGTSPYDNDFSDSFAGLRVGYNFNNRKWRFDSNIALQWERNGINGAYVSELYPLINISGSFSPSQHHSAQMFFHYGANYPGESVKTPNILQDNELMFKTGNPDLTLSRQITLNAQYNWIADNKFSMSVFAQYFGEYGLYVPVFLTYDNGRALLKTYSSQQDYNRTQLGSSFNLKLLDGNLQVAAQPSVSIFRYKGCYDMSKAPFALNASLSYYIRRFFFQASYQMANRTIQGNLGVWYRDRDFYQLQAGWGNNNWNVRLSAINMFRGDWLAATQTLNAPLYSEIMSQGGSYYHRRINLAVTYTFDYGKKVRRGNEVGEQRGAASAILK